MKKIGTGNFSFEVICYIGNRLHNVVALLKLRRKADHGTSRSKDCYSGGGPSPKGFSKISSNTSKKQRSEMSELTQPDVILECKEGGGR